MEELVFASEDEAIQYLSDQSKEKILIAGLWTNVWTKAGEWFVGLDKEYAEFKRILSNLEDNLGGLSKELNKNISAFAAPGKITHAAHQLNNAKGLMSVKLLGQFLVGVDKLFEGSNKLPSLQKSLDEYKKLLKTYKDTSVEAKYEQKLQEVVGESISSMVRENLKSVLDSIVSSGVKAGPVFASFDSEKDAIQFLSDSTGMKVVIASDDKNEEESSDE